MTRKKAKQQSVYYLVPYLQMHYLDGEWKQVFKSVQGSFVRLKTDDTTNIAMAMIEGFWLFSIHWVYKKKWNPKHKIPYQSDAKKVEPFGDFLLSILNLCEALHTIHPFGSHYSNAAKWFDCIAWELKNRDLLDLFDLSGKKGTDDEVRTIRKRLADYRYGINPHDFQKEPHTWRLIEAALKVSCSKAFPKIGDEFWRGVRQKNKPLGFQHAYSAWAAALESPTYQAMAIKNGKILVKQGRKKDTPRWKEIPLPSDAEKGVLSNPLWARFWEFNLEKSMAGLDVVQMSKP